nr:hypothetical protein [uncultured bacterium]
MRISTIMGDFPDCFVRFSVDNSQLLCLTDKNSISTQFHISI